MFFQTTQRHHMVLSHPRVGSEALALSQLYAKRLCEAQGQEQNCLIFGNWAKQAASEC